MRQTSIDAYHEIRDNGLLSKRRFEVYDVLYNKGPLTANEIVRHFKKAYPQANPSGFHARLSELKRMEVIREVGEKPDVVSGNKCYVWDVTNKLPKKLENDRISRKRLLLMREVLREVYSHKDTPRTVKVHIRDRLNETRS